MRRLWAACAGRRARRLDPKRAGFATGAVRGVRGAETDKTSSTILQGASRAKPADASTGCTLAAAGVASVPAEVAEDSDAAFEDNAAAPARGAGPVTLVVWTTRPIGWHAATPKYKNTSGMLVATPCRAAVADLSGGSARGGTAAGS